MTSRTRAGPWGKTLAAGRRECMGNSKRVLKRSIGLQHVRKDRSSPYHALRIATQRGGVFISEANGHIGVWCVALLNCLEAADGWADDVSHYAISEKRLRLLS